MVADTRQHRLSRPALPEVYDLSAGSQMTLVAHTTLRPTSMVGPIRRELATVDKELPLAEVQTMENILDLSSSHNRTFMRLIGTFAAVALLLASIGIYGLVAFAMSQRRHEIGIRVALGATRGRIVRMALGSAGVLVLAGMTTGVLGSLLLTKYLKALLYEVSPLDPLTFASVPVFLAVVTLGASFIPAIRAAAVDPVCALRQE